MRRTLRTTLTLALLAALASYLVSACGESSPTPREGDDAVAPRPAPPEAPTEPAVGAPRLPFAPPAPTPRVVAPATGPDRYETVVLDPVLEELRERDEAWDKARGDETSAVRERQKAEKERKRRERKVFVSSLPPEKRPASLDAFHTVPHRPPVAQYATGTCWSFATTSFLESEVQRLTGRDVKLSEMGTVYHEYLAKAARYVAERGESVFGQGSETNAVLRVWKDYGALPLSVYPGVVAEDGRHDHARLARELAGMLDHVKAAGLWDAATVEGMLRVVLDNHLGHPPEQFSFEGRTYTPKTFASELLQIDPDAYENVMSTLSEPFWTRAVFDVPDNWWRDASYLNVPLDDFYAGLKGAIRGGFGVAIAIDVSEPGRDADNDVMFVPSYDVPGDHIDQRARELRLYNRSTTDDHGLHVVGWAEHDGHDWYLIKDSGRSARRGRFEGYYFVRDDYVRLKVLAYTVHRDAIPGLLARAPKG